MGLAVKSVRKQVLLDGLLKLTDCSGILDYYRKLLVGLDGVESSSNLSQETLLDLLGEGFIDSLVEKQVEQTIKAVANIQSELEETLTEIMERDDVLLEIQIQIDEERRKKEEAERQRKRQEDMRNAARKNRGAKQRKVPQYTQQDTDVDTHFRVDEEDTGDPIERIQEKYEERREESRRREERGDSPDTFESIDEINKQEQLELEEEEQRQEAAKKEILQPPKTFGPQYYASLKTLNMEVPSDGNFTNEELNAAFKEATRGYKGSKQTPQQTAKLREMIQARKYLKSFLEED